MIHILFMYYLRAVYFAFVGLEWLGDEIERFREDFKNRHYNPTFRITALRPDLKISKIGTNRSEDKVIIKWLFKRIFPGSVIVSEDKY